MTSLDRPLRAGRFAVPPVIALATAVLGTFGLILSAMDHRVAAGSLGLVPIAFALVGAVILHRRPGNRIGQLLLAAAVPAALLATGTVYAWHAIAAHPGSLPGAVVAAAVTNAAPLPVLGLLVALLPQVFPSGSAISPRWRPGIVAAWVFIVAGTAGNAFGEEAVQGLPHTMNPAAIAGGQPVWNALQALAAIALLVAVGYGVTAMIVRWRRAHGDQRQQIKWFVAGTVPVLIPVALHDLAPTVTGYLIALMLMLMPAAIGVAVLRYRLYDLDLVLGRILVYAALSAATAAVYLSIVVLTAAVAGRERGLGVQVAATVVAAALFQPLRLRVQRAVDRLLYGDRARPYDALSRLGQALAHAPAPDAALELVVASVTDALRIPYAGIDLTIGDRPVHVAAHGEPVEDVVRFPMVFQDEIVGNLAVAPRGPGEGFSAADQRLLGDLARQAGVVAHASRTTAALQQARLELVSAREEERRRLRRDLHDGLGPVLAGVGLGLSAARTVLDRDPARATALLAQLSAQVDDAVHDIRRLVYGLRPPALDEYGLYRALQQHAAGYDGVFAVTLTAPGDGLGDLPAAVEVAAYRIATEAMTNVARHAAATTCHVTLDRDRALHVTVTDNGRGLRPGTPAGVGLTAMRERAAELGGRLTVTAAGGPAANPGSRVRAVLPIPEVSR